MSAGELVGPPGIPLCPMLLGTGLTKRFGSRPVFRDVTFTVPSGCIAAVTGSNGAGKSTLLRLVAGLTAPTSGTVCWQEGQAPAAAVRTGSRLWGQCGLAAPDAPVHA